MTSALSSIDTDNCTIYLVDIPPDRNTIPKLNEYFSKFGKVLTVHVGYNGDPGASKVTFASVNEAVAALNCPDAVLNNRFVKMSSKLPTSTSADLDQSDSKNCSHCNRTFASEYHRNWHIKRMHIVCEICHLTFVSTDLYKKHYSAYHPNATRQKKSPKQTLEHERLPKKIDQVAAPEADLLCAKLSEKIKALKGKLKETEKNHAKKMKSLQKEKKHFEAQLKEKDADLVALQQKVTILEQSNIRHVQEAQNERMKSKMIYETLKAVYQCVENATGSQASLPHLNHFLSMNGN